MAELSSSEPVAHVSPIWPKRKGRKSFEKVAKTLSKVLRFIQKARNSSIHAVSERLKDFDNENQKKEERLEKVKSLAKIKKDGADERKHNGWLIYREKLRYLWYLERMNTASTRYSSINRPMRNASNIGQLKHFNTREKSFESSVWTKCLKTEQKVKEFKPKAESSNGLFNAVRSRGADSISTKRRPGQLNASPSAGTSKPAGELTSQPSSLDVKLDPRFQNLLSSLTPIDC